MKKLLNYFKKNRLPIPIGLGLLLAKIPYGRRPGIGKLYKKQHLAISEFPQLSKKAQKEYIYQQFMRVFTHAYNNIKFYQDLYKRHNIRLDDIRSFDDIEKLPIISKHDLAKYDIEDRSYSLDNRMIVNTGGSSGKSFAFYMDPQRYGNEWAHIHDMWSKHEFSPRDLKLSFDGRVKREKGKIVYDFARNSLLYDIYSDANVMAEQLLKIVRKYPIKYLHGYPSAIYEFALYCETNDQLLRVIKPTLRAAFLSSEYPSPHYRTKIEEVFNIPTQSFYGHTETCVLAVEKERFDYKVYQTYGYVESVNFEDGHHLIGTSYYNFASPLIRYDTSDLIEPIFDDCIDSFLVAFRIKEGRSGEFIVDKQNKKIPLTGLIYGRHHDLFNTCDHIQILQDKQGEAIILYVTKNDIDADQAQTLFDSRNVDIDFSFRRIKSPVLSSSGKANLMIKSVG